MNRIAVMPTEDVYKRQAHYKQRNRSQRRDCAERRTEEYGTLYYKSAGYCKNTVSYTHLVAIGYIMRNRLFLCYSGKYGVCDK